MKFTITRRNTKNRQTLRTVDIVKWMEQIAHDDAQQTVGKFREEVADSISDYDFIMPSPLGAMCSLLLNLQKTLTATL